MKRNALEADLWIGDASYKTCLTDRHRGTLYPIPALHSPPPVVDRGKSKQLTTPCQDGREGELGSDTFQDFEDRVASDKRQACPPAAPA
jgi:hypothetical protein